MSRRCFIPATTTDNNSSGLLAVGDGWFSGAFEVAVGDTISEALERFSDELRATLDAYKSDSAGLSADDCIKLVRRIQYRLSVAAEWAALVEDLDANRGQDVGVQEDENA